MLSGFSLISRIGSIVRSISKAINIEILVRKPKYIVGIKLESNKIEKPRVMISVVKYIALPIEVWDL